MIFNTSFSFGSSTLNPKREAGIIYLSRTACSAYGLEEWLMRYKSEETMDRIVKSVERFFFAHHRSPSITEIASDVGCSRSTIHAYLREMNQLGRLHYDGKTLETSVTQKADAEFTLSPVLGSISCGLPEYAEENFEEYVALPTALFGSGEFFLLRANGNSMIEAGIEPGDLVVVRKQTTAEEGDIVVALVENETTLKRYYKDHQRQCVRLHPENSRMKDIYVQECTIQGVAQHVIKAL